MSLDEIDRIFTIKYGSGTKMTYKDATVKAKEALEMERTQLGMSRASSGEKDMVMSHEEKV